MKVDIYSRKAVESMNKEDFPKNTAVISFYDPDGTKFDYTGCTENVFYVQIYDIDIDVLDKYGLTEETYFPEADDLAKFIYDAKNKGFDIICQCQYGQSRSAACAAAILQHFEQDGISIFADYRYYPNQLVYHKVFDALERYKNNHS